MKGVIFIANIGLLIRAQLNHRDNVVRLNKDIQKLQGQLQHLRLKTNLDTKQVKQYQTELGKTNTQAKKLTDTYQKQQMQQKKMLNTVRSFRAREHRFIQGQDLKQMNQLEHSLRNLDPASKNFNRNLQNMKMQLHDVQTNVGIYKRQAQEATRFTSMFGQSILEAGKKFATWMAIATLVNIATYVSNGIWKNLVNLITQGCIIDVKFVQ